MLSLRACAAAILLALTPVAQAQTPPSASEIAAYTGLHAAAHKGDAAEIARLIAAKADPNGRDGAGRTPLHVATFARKHEAMRALAKGGADPRAQENRKYDTVTIAAVADDLATMKVALEIGGSAKDITSVYTGTALIAAAHLGHVEVVQELIRAGAPLDHINNLHWTALMESVVLGDGGPRHTATLKALVDAGARRDLADREGRTPLDHARARGYAEMVRLLEK
ncbi:MAG TPA: ankyrin repeat domain-containing protein [Beijerinckiaceae bacterium]|nr:ankyrin repeat domain-containing protein [Beijerinckiaceae bacterium]